MLSSSRGILGQCCHCPWVTFSRFPFFVDLGEEKEKEIRSFEEDQAANVARNAEIKEVKAPKIRYLLKYE